MKNHLLYCSIIAFLISCTPQQPTEEKAGIATQSVSNSYNPPVISNDNRTQKIEALAPAIQQLIEEHAEARNIPGIAYGIVVDDEFQNFSSFFPYYCFINHE